jgi:hypothetical protein
MGWDNVPKLMHTSTNVGEYKEASPNTFKWIPNFESWSLANVPNIWEKKCRQQTLSKMRFFL